MRYEFRTGKNVAPEALDDLFDSVSWRRRGDTWREVQVKSSAFYTVWDGELLVGTGRYVEDGAMCSIWDVVVRKEYQGKVGLALMRTLRDSIRERERANGREYVWIGGFPNEKNGAAKLYEFFGGERVTGMRLKPEKKD